ncbi:MAG: hypothetical protein Q9218_004828 [Villophora microphyllina]
MRLQWLRSNLIALLLYISPALTTPLNPASDVLSLSTHNTNTSTGPPPEFKVRLTTDTHTPLDNRDIWINILHFTFEISGLGLQNVWNPGSWSLPSSTVAVSLQLPPGAKTSQMTGQQLLWAVNYISVSTAVSRRFCAMTGVLMWEGREFGRILIGPLHAAIIGGPVISLPTADDNVTVSKGVEIPETDSASNASDYLVTVQVRYGEKVIDENDIFQTGIRALIDAAELGLQKSVPLLITNGLRGCTWKLVRDKRYSGDPLLADYSRRAVRDTVHKMAHDDRFRQIYVLVYVGNPLVAIGGFDSKSSTSTGIVNEMIKV